MQEIKTIIIEDEDAAVNRLKKELNVVQDVQFNVLQVFDIAMMRQNSSLWISS